MKSRDNKTPVGLDYVFTFGQYEGLTVEEVLLDDPGYLTWCHEMEVVLLKSAVYEQACEAEGYDEDYYDYSD